METKTARTLKIWQTDRQTNETSEVGENETKKARENYQWWKKLNDLWF